MPHPVGHRVESAHRLTDQDRIFELERTEKSLDVLDLRVDTVIDRWRPFAIAMPALVERDTAVALMQHQGDDVPGMGVQTTSVQEHSWVTIAAPVEVVKTHRTNDQLMVLR